ncbi:MAG: MFS transporter [Deltaproteobacteria bacterium]|nr:MFS transporter [Deltaproteobacteria bacterium]MBW2048436.1 MFS transporter [Deltaproteobacteria bacterium]MBW2110406.1 MFS transporter [Deltaproteobacteria bacterium]MBW2351983.1 MFS transporter [Deltaproteobacteria bacterium]HDZ89704.1 MFS transporter [Deltaproteobacteria bacterium]
MSRRWAIFLITSANFFLSQFYRASNAVIAGDLLRDLGLDTRGLGTISAAFFYAFALTQIPISIFLDRVGARRVMTGLSLLGIAGALIFSQSHSIGPGLMGRALLGIGMACNLMGTLKLLTVWFGPSTFATLTGIIFSIGTVGNMAATTPLVFLVNGVGWRNAFLVIAGVNLILVVIMYAVVRDRPQGGPPVPSQGPPPGVGGAFSGLALLLRKKEYWIISVASLVSYGVFGAFQTLWAGPYLMEAMGQGVMNAGHLILLMNVGSISGGPVWGVLSDRVFKTRKWVISGGLLILVIILLLLADLSRETGFLILALLFFSFGFFRSSGLLMYVQIKESMPLDMAGTAMTGINFFTMIGPALFLQGLGIFMQSLYPLSSRGGQAFTASFLVCALCFLMVALFYLFTRETVKGRTGERGDPRLE